MKPEDEATKPLKCWNCKSNDHCKRNCPKLQRYFCQEHGHMKKHCIKFFLENKFKTWTKRKSRIKATEIKPTEEKEEAKEIKKLEECFKDLTIIGKGQEHRKKKKTEKPAKKSQIEKRKRWIIKKEIQKEKVSPLLKETIRKQKE